MRLLPLLLTLAACLASEDEGPPPDDNAPDAAPPPPTAYCDGTDNWPSQSANYESAVLELVNIHRAAGTVCNYNAMPVREPLAMNTALQCAARMHSKDMVERGYFDHEDPDGVLPWDRMEEAGYSYTAAAENIATGISAQAAVDAWMASTQGHCENIMGDFEHIGIGTYQGHWTQVFGND